MSSLISIYLGSSRGRVLLPVYNHVYMYSLHGEEALHQAIERQRTNDSQCPT